MSMSAGLGRDGLSRLSLLKSDRRFAGQVHILLHAGDHHNVAPVLLEQHELCPAGVGRQPENARHVARQYDFEI